MRCRQSDGFRLEAFLLAVKRGSAIAHAESWARESFGGVSGGTYSNWLRRSDEKSHVKLVPCLESGIRIYAERNVLQSFADPSIVPTASAIP